MPRDRFVFRAGAWRRRYARHAYRWARLRHLTMVKRRYFVDNLFLAEEVMRRDDLAGGCFVECGTWAGGMSFAMMQALPGVRRFHLFDSFEGLPEPDARDGRLALEGNETGAIRFDNNRADFETCRQNAERYRRPDQQVVIHRGWFDDTLPKFDDETPIAILRLDGDWYHSTRIALEYLFDRVMHGGLILVDDYHFWDGCSRAVHDFLSHRSRLERIRESPGGVAYMIRQTRPAKTTHPARPPHESGDLAVPLRA